MGDLDFIKWLMLNVPVVGVMVWMQLRQDRERREVRGVSAQNAKDCHDHQQLGNDAMRDMAVAFESMKSALEASNQTNAAHTSAMQRLEIEVAKCRGPRSGM